MAKTTKRISLKTTPAKITKLQNAVDLLAEYAAEAGGAWKHLTPSQRKSVRLASPILDTFIKSARPFFVHKFAKDASED